MQRGLTLFPLKLYSPWLLPLNGAMGTHMPMNIHTCIQNWHKTLLQVLELVDLLVHAFLHFKSHSL